ncbi:MULTISPECIES: molybdopterin dinucleotide binding domain-containing protein [unclassified Arthrobacter]|uniref:molybdopterin dinucleotide binding domain-containing protein n=1 Tax=unclassified Arthrobacter TaxID=235627 RepID=UPI001F1A1F12|nr:molybdopterin dinucleotide binding domain-containing protein [Arthrobacter sp. FW305-BF8]UKA56476.1 hypothetical protein LFT45_09895 [Arthrobacter sp. FW305-BF8]
MTGRTLFHFHTRTKTARVPELQAAAPEVWIEVSAQDAGALGIAEEDLAEVSTPRGSVRAPVRISGIRVGVLFLPFHYGYWDTDGGHQPDGAGRAANELTITDWDPASKQPIFKTAAANLKRIGAGDAPSSAPTNTASAPIAGAAAVPTAGIASALADEEIRTAATMAAP